MVLNNLAFMIDVVKFRFRVKKSQILKVVELCEIFLMKDYVSMIWHFHVLNH